MNKHLSNYFEIGKIVSAHGIKGYVKVYPLTDDADRFFELKSILLDPERADSALHIDNVENMSNNTLLIKFKEVKDRNEAEALKGRFVYIERAQAAPLGDNEYYLGDLVGLNVCDTNGVLIGKLAEIIQTGAVDVFYIRGEKSYMLPALQKNITPLLDQGMIQVDLTNGVECD